MFKFLKRNKTQEAPKAPRAQDEIRPRLYTLGKGCQPGDSVASFDGETLVPARKEEFKLTPDGVLATVIFPASVPPAPKAPKPEPASLPVSKARPDPVPGRFTMGELPLSMPETTLELARKEARRKDQATVLCWRNLNLTPTHMAALGLMREGGWLSVHYLADRLHKQFPDYCLTTIKAELARLADKFGLTLMRGAQGSRQYCIKQEGYIALVEAEHKRDAGLGVHSVEGWRAVPWEQVKEGETIRGVTKSKERKV